MTSERESEKSVLERKVAEPDHPAEQAGLTSATRTGSIDDAQSDALGSTGMTYAGSGGPPSAAGGGD